MNEKQRLKEIEKIWKKYATGRSNLICTYLPHANQVAFFKELNSFISEILPNANPIDESV